MFLYIRVQYVPVFCPHMYQGHWPCAEQDVNQVLYFTIYGRQCHNKDHVDTVRFTGPSCVVTDRAATAADSRREVLHYALIGRAR